MSPGISLAIPLPSERPTPRERVLEALAMARAAGTPLALGTEPGVAPGRFTGGWVVDRRKRAPFVNLVGLALLHFQPKASLDEDPSGVLARELGVSLAFIEGCGDGWAMETMSEHWLKVDRRGYLGGFELGAESRFYASLVCKCGARRPKGESRCPGCDR